MVASMRWMQWMEHSFGALKHTVLSTPRQAYTKTGCSSVRSTGHYTLYVRATVTYYGHLRQQVIVISRTEKYRDRRLLPMTWYTSVRGIIICTLSMYLMDTLIGIKHFPLDGQWPSLPGTR